MNEKSVFFVKRNAYGPQISIFDKCGNLPEATSDSN